MTLIKHELYERGYTSHHEQDERRAAALGSALTRQRFAFSHFCTVTFPHAVTERHVVLAMNKILRTLDGLNQQRVRFFYELSLSPRHQFNPTTDNTRGDRHLITRWHVHALLGNIAPALTPDRIERAISKITRGIADVQFNDGAEELASYLTSRNTGNLVGALQQTNDRNIIEAMQKAGFVI